MKRILVALLMVSMLPAVPARAEAMFTGCYQQRHTTPLPVRFLEGLVPPSFTVATDDAGLLGTHVARAYQCGTAEFMLVTVPIEPPAGSPPSAAGTTSALVAAFSEIPALTATLVAGCFAAVTHDANLVFGLFDFGYARIGSVFNDAGLDGIGLQNSVQVGTGADAASGELLFAQRAGVTHALTLTEGAGRSVVGEGVTIFQSGNGPVGTAAQPAVAEHRDGDFTTRLIPADAC